MKKQEQNFAEIMSAEEAIAIRKDTEQSIVNGLTEEGAGVYCSFLPETLEDKAKMFNAMNGGDNTVKEAINKDTPYKHGINQTYKSKGHKAHPYSSEYVL